MKKYLTTRLQKAVGLFIVIISLGVLGYTFIASYSFVDALYMTVVTVSTVGFSEVHPFTDTEKIFSFFLIITSIVSFGYTFNAFSEYIIAGHIFEQIKFKKVQKKIEKLKDHTIICGMGRNGKQSIQKLMNYKKDFVVVERDSELLKEIDRLGYLYVDGDATLDETLLKAGVEKAGNIIIT